MKNAFRKDCSIYMAEFNKFYCKKSKMYTQKQNQI